MDIKEKLRKASKFAQEGHLGQAESIYMELLQVNPDDIEVLKLYGYLCFKGKDFKKACGIFERGYNLSKDLHILKGLALSKYNLREMDDAIKLYIELIDMEPVYENYRILTNLLADKVATDAEKSIYFAKKYITAAYKKFPLDPEIMTNYATYCFNSGNFKEAENVCRYALKINSELPTAWELMGFIYEGLYCDEENAQICHQKSIDLGMLTSGYYNLGVSYTKTCEYEKADKAFDSAIEFAKSSTDLIVKAKAENYLKQRKFNDGYKLLINYSNSPYFKTNEKKWKGEIGKDKTLLVILDMCLGDHIFFSRYFPFLKDKFKTVYVQTTNNLRKVFENNFDGITFVDQEEVPEYDYFTPYSHLPYYLGMDFEHIPSSCGYLKSEKSDIESDKLKVGLCWETGNIGLRDTIHRMINIKEFENLLKEDYDFYSFQLNSAMDYKKYNMVDLSGKIHDFSDTARYLMSMDVLVSVDTSVANLAGALGVKTFMFLPYYSDWRWFDNDKKTEWYDSITIYKQSEKHTWQPEFNRIIEDLKKINN